MEDAKPDRRSVGPPKAGTAKGMTAEGVGFRPAPFCRVSLSLEKSLALDLNFRPLVWIRSIAIFLVYRGLAE